MSFALRGVTHCENCGKSLNMNEYVLCNECKKKEKRKGIKNMSKVYKGYELMKMFAEKKIKNGTKFKDLTDNNYADNSNIYRYENNNFIGRYGGMNILMLLKHDFELIEDETIDIDNIEELKWRESEKEHLGYGVLVANDKINELVQAVKQLNKEIKNIKEK